MEQLILLCGDDMDSMLTAVYDAWERALKGTPVSIEAVKEDGFWCPLFSVCERVKADPDKAEKVARTVRRRFSGTVWNLCFEALLHPAADRVDAVYRFLRLGFRMGDRVTEYLQDPYVSRVCAYARKVGREAQHFWGFTRFREARTEDGRVFLHSRLAPKSNIIPLLAPHFADRFPEENWIIYDETRQIAALKEAGRPWFMADMAEARFAQAERLSDGDRYETLFTAFFESIAIEARKNPRCQRSMLPVWCRRHMTEFSDDPARS